MEILTCLTHPSGHSHPSDHHDLARNKPMQDPEKRITVWNKVERRKLSGNAAPKLKNLEVYLAKNPNCEVYINQDKEKNSRSWDVTPLPYPPSTTCNPPSVSKTPPVSIPDTQGPCTSPFDTSDANLTPVTGFGFEHLLSDNTEYALGVGVLSPQLSQAMRQVACSPISSLGSPPFDGCHRNSELDLLHLTPSAANITSSFVGQDDVFDFMEE